MMRPTLRSTMRLCASAMAAVALTLVACGGEVPERGLTGRVELAVAPLSLPGIVDACYGVTVLNEADAPVWSRTGLCASDYGDGRSALSYVGTCDATDTNGDTVANNTVVLTIEGLFAPAPVNDFRNPCAAPYAPSGCRLTVPCRENSDARVEFNLTVMREANQGFFDIAVTFEDIFCSAKVDCAYPATEGGPARPLELVFDPVTGERVPSIVWAFACTDGDPGGATASATHLYMDDLVLRCGETRYTIDAADGPGNLYPGGVGAPAPIVQAMVFEGREAIRNGGEDADKLYWNVALGLNTDFFSPEPPAMAPACVLETKATAHKGPLPSGVTPANTNYPYVSVTVPLNGAGGADILCTQHPLDGEPPHDGVATAYTGPNPELSGFATATFGNVLSLGPTGVESTPIDYDECAALSPCGPNTTCMDLSGGFACTCLAGYVGNAYTSGCADIDECDLESDNCHIAATCTNTPGAFECDCLPGYDGDGVSCTDLDGCLVGNGGCSTFASCENQPGPGVTCTCFPGYGGDGLTCTDLDGCLVANGGCSTFASCENQPGPGVTCACFPGYGGDGLTCTDLDGCLVANGGCSTNASCENQPGPNVVCQCFPGFAGDGLTCTDVNECLDNNGGCSLNAACTNTAGGRTCACNSGFSGDGVTCTDINECLSNNGGCSLNAACTNTTGSRTCACNSGFSGDGVTCTDINECLSNNGGCSANALCTNTTGSRTCACNSGFAGDGVTCTDVNECLTNNGGCSLNAACTNTMGSRTCACNSGFVGDGFTCTDVDECLTNNGGCSLNAACTNTTGSRTCACNSGFSGDGVTCTDINECLTNNGGCSLNAACTNTTGSRTCACNSGFVGDGFTCTDVNECLTNNGGCATNATCTNTPGSRTCACNSGFTGDGLTCVQSLVISASTTDYNVFVAAGSPSTARAIVVTVNAGVTVGASSTSVAAFRTGALPAGSTVRIVNNGNIYGAGGRGGGGGGTQFGATVGSPGGDAIASSVPLTIDNTNGQIFGGGGGGGGGNLCTRSNVLACGGSGGGGRGQVGGGAGSWGSCSSGAAYPNGTSGGAGSVSSAGGGGANASSGFYPNQFSSPFYCTSGAGGAGGDWGQAGAASGQAILDGGVQYAANAGGAAGYAVRLSGGATLAWQGGNTVARVKGLAQ